MALQTSIGPHSLYHAEGGPQCALEKAKMQGLRCKAVTANRESGYARNSKTSMAVVLQLNQLLSRCLQQCSQPAPSKQTPGAQRVGA